MAWTIDYTDTALKQLKKLDRPTAQSLVCYLSERISPLADPRSSGKALVGHLTGLWRYRVGDFRVICEIQDNTVRILVVQLGHRSKIYD